MKQPSLTTISRQPITPATGEAITVAGQVANQFAERNEFSNYLSRKAENTRRAQLADLDTFGEYLVSAGIPGAPSGEMLQTEPETWRGVSWGLVSGFVQWMLDQGYSTATMRRKLSTVKVYAKLAMKAGIIDTAEQSRIATVTAYNGKEARRIDEKRTEAGLDTRIGEKKAGHVSIDDRAALLKRHPDTPQGRRDALLMCLLLDHGLRVSEVALLEVEHFDMKAGELRFYRPKVDTEQTHKLTADTLRALHAYMNAGDMPAKGPILRGSRKGGRLTEVGMSERAVTKRVRDLGESVGLEGLSAHDCRHYWATKWARKVDLFRLQEAGGWNSLAMPRRYTEDAKIANEGMA